MALVLSRPLASGTSPSIDVDAAGHPTAHAAAGAGFEVIGQYLTGSFAYGPAQIAEATAAKTGILSIYERQAQAALGGAAAGGTDATLALQAARAKGQPPGTAIVLTCDFEPLPSQMATVVSYFRTGHSIIHGSGYLSMGYGGFAVIEAITGVVDLLWQAAGWSTGGKRAPGIALLQLLSQTDVGGVTCDEDEQFVSFVGAWNSDGPFDSPTPIPSPTGGNVPAPTDTVDAWFVPGTNGADGFALHADGGLFAIGQVADGLLTYIAIASDGSRYHFGPNGDHAGGIFSYPALPATTRKGSRYFTRMVVLSYAGKATDQSIADEG